MRDLVSTSVLVWAFRLSQLASMSGVDHIVIGASQVCIRAKWPISAGAYHGFCSMKRLGILLLGPRDGMLVHRRVTLSIKFVPIYSPGWREALWEWSVLPMNTTICLRQGLEPRPFDPECSALATAPLTLDEMGNNILVILLLAKEWPANHRLEDTIG